MKSYQMFTPCRRAADGRDLFEEQGLRRLAECSVLARLGSINFLGILGRNPQQPRHSRLQHSLATAHLTARMLRTIDQFALRHAIAAAALHDAAQWALSHTCEGAFERVCEVSSKEILYAMFFNEPPVDARYHVGGLLEILGIEPGVVWDLLRDRSEAVQNFAGTSLYAAAVAAASPINPDTLDGIARAASAFGVSCPDVVKIAEAVVVEGSSLRLPVSAIPLVDDFWSAKAEVYRTHIHARSSLILEVAASQTVLHEYCYASFRELFDLSDDNVTDVVDHRPLPWDDQPVDLDLLFRHPGTYELDRTVRFTGDSVGLLELNRRYRSVRPTKTAVHSAPVLRYTRANGSTKRRASGFTASAPA